jgi:hypothetical protein
MVYKELDVSFDFKSYVICIIIYSRVTSHVKWLNDEKTNVSRTICVLVFRELMYLENQSASEFLMLKYLYICFIVYRELFLVYVYSNVCKSVVLLLYPSFLFLFLLAY